MELKCSQSALYSLMANLDRAQIYDGWLIPNGIQPLHTSPG